MNACSALSLGWRVDASTYRTVDGAWVGVLLCHVPGGEPFGEVLLAGAWARNLFEDTVRALTGAVGALQGGDVLTFVQESERAVGTARRARMKAAFESRRRSRAR